MLGLCPALAVTNTVANSLAMGVATFFVLVGSSLLVSLVQALHPARGAHLDLHPDHRDVRDGGGHEPRGAGRRRMHKALGAFIALIVVNCMILGRQEAFASKQRVGRSLLDALGTGVGFIIALVMMGGVREILGNGTLPRRAALR